MLGLALLIIAGVLFSGFLLFDAGEPDGDNRARQPDWKQNGICDNKKMILYDDDIRWEPANKIIESQTNEINRDFHASRPKPRAWKMGMRKNNCKCEQCRAILGVSLDEEFDRLLQ